MTRERMDVSVKSETSSTPEILPNDPAVEDATEASLSCSEQILVKPEAIFMPDDILPILQCRLCHSSDHMCTPIFNLGGGTELTEANFETIYRLSDVVLTYERDHASVVCSYCLLKIEEYTVIREVWQMKNNITNESKMPTTEPKTPIPACTKPADLREASTQTDPAIDYQTDANATESAEATVSVANVETAPLPVPAIEQNVINVEEENNQQTRCEVIDVDEYICSNAGSKRRRTKAELIQDIMRIVKQQYRSKPHKKNRSSR